MKNILTGEKNGGLTQVTNIHGINVSGSHENTLLHRNVHMHTRTHAHIHTNTHTLLYSAL